MRGGELDHRAPARRLRRRADDLGLGQLRRLLPGEGPRRGRRQAAVPRRPRGAGLLRGLETGELAEDEFEQRFAELPRPRRGGGPDRQHVRAACCPSSRWSTRSAPPASGGVKTGLISNSWSTSHYDRDLLDGALRRRRDLGRGRPAQAPAGDLPARRRAARRSSRSECVFVDDLRENCAGAEAVGMTAILHRPPRREHPAHRGALRDQVRPLGRTGCLPPNVKRGALHGNHHAQQRRRDARARSRRLPDAAG